MSYFFFWPFTETKARGASTKVEKVIMKMQICKTEIHIYLYFVKINKPSKSDTFLISDNKSLTSLWGFWFGLVLKQWSISLFDFYSTHQTVVSQQW